VFASNASTSPPNGKVMKMVDKESKLHSISAKLEKMGCLRMEMESLYTECYREFQEIDSDYDFSYDLDRLECADDYEVMSCKIMNNIEDLMNGDYSSL